MRVPALSRTSEHRKPRPLLFRTHGFYKGVISLTKHYDSFAALMWFGEAARGCAQRVAPLLQEAQAPDSTRLAKLVSTSEITVVNVPTPPGTPPAPNQWAIMGIFIITTPVWLL